MSLTLAEVKFLLGHAMGYDNRKMPGDANLAAWVEASRRASWTLPAALEALHRQLGAAQPRLGQQGVAHAFGHAL